MVNLVTGHGSSIGKLLASHADIDKIAITGSTNTGRQIIKDCADTFKHVTVELVFISSYYSNYL